jgi:hypothetical protein
MEGYWIFIMVKEKKDRQSTKKNFINSKGFDNEK